jgi:hypothetical protein
VGAGLVAVWMRLEGAPESLLYKIKNGLIDIDSHRYIQANDSRTRGKDRLYQERTSSEAFGNSFFPKTIRDWNQDLQNKNKNSDKVNNIVIGYKCIIFTY